MTQNKKDLLMKDLTARLPYSVKIHVDDKIEILEGINTLDNIIEYDSFLASDIEEVKPYLFPMSSMTEEQKNELREMEWSFDNSAICNIIECLGIYRAYVDHRCCSKLIDWCIKNHFDYRGLIEKGLALDASELNIY